MNKEVIKKDLYNILNSLTKYFILHGNEENLFDKHKGDKKNG